MTGRTSIGRTMAFDATGWRIVGSRWIVRPCKQATETSPRLWQQSSLTVPLVVFEEDVERRLVLLDERRLQEKSFRTGHGGDILDPARRGKGRGGRSF